MNALPGVQVCKCASDVNGEGKAKAPGKGQAPIVYICAQVSIGNIFRYNVDCARGWWGLGETKVEDDIWVPGFSGCHSSQIICPLG